MRRICCIRGHDLVTCCIPTWSRAVSGYVLYPVTCCIPTWSRAVPGDPREYWRYPHVVKLTAMFTALPPISQK